MLFPLLLSSLCSVTACRLINSRALQKMDHILCKVELFKQVDALQEAEDPRAFAEAYFNRSGFPCKTYCRIRSTHTSPGLRQHIFDSPHFIPCGIDRYCAKGGKCKRIGSSVEEESDHRNKAKDAKSESVSTSTQASPAISASPASVASIPSSSPTPAAEAKAKEPKNEEAEE